MEYLKERTFEIFRYLLPGIIFQIVIFSSFINIKNFIERIENYKDISFIFILIGLTASYTFGVILDEANYRFFKKVNFKKDSRDYVSKSDLTTSEKYSLLREFSNKNYTYVEYWNALKGACHNLGLCFITLFFISAAKLIWLRIHGDSNEEQNIWIFLLILSFISTILMYKRGFLYDSFADSERDSTIDILNLNKKN